MARQSVGTGANTIKGSTGSFVDTFKDLSYDQDYDIINSYNFMLRVEAIFSIAVRNIRGINKQLEYDHIQEGGLNDYVHTLRKPVTQPYTFTVERYMSQDWLEDFYDPLALGTEFILPLILYINRNARSDGKIPVRYYVFTGAKVSGVQVGDLDAEKSGLHTVTYTITYSNLISFTMPIAEATTPNPYKFADNNAPNRTAKYARTMEDLGLEHQEATPEDPDDPDSVFKATLETAKKNPLPARTKTEMAALAKDYAAERQKYWKERWETQDNNQAEANKANKLPRQYPNSSSAVIPSAPEKPDTTGTEGESTSPVADPNAPRKYPEKSSANKLPEVEKPEGSATEVVVNPKKRKYIVNPKRHLGAKTEKSAIEPSGQLTKAQMEARKKEYIVNPKKHTGEKSTESAVKPADQLSKEAMEKKAVKYPPTKRAKQAAKVL